MSIIVDRIKKLLRLSKSPNLHEAQLALDRAFEIAAKNQIDIQTLDLGEDINQIVSEACRIGYRLSLTKRQALGIVDKFFNVNVVLSYPSVTFIGTESDIKIARHVFEFLTGEIDRSVNAVRLSFGKRFTENRRRNYIAGWFYAISKGLGERKEQLSLEENRLALILVKNEGQRNEKQAEIFPRTESTYLPKPKRREKSWLIFGYEEGGKVQINPGIENRKPVAVLGA